MARIRTVKPELFKHEELFDLERETGLPIRTAFIGLFTCCDKEGRFKWKPRTLKIDVLPHDEIDFSRVLDALATRGFVVKYAFEEEEFGFIPTFSKHQVINNRESESDLPVPHECLYISMTSTREARVGDALTTRTQGKGKERKGREGNGREEEGKEIVVDRRGAPTDRDVIPTIFAYWQKVMDSPKSKLDAKRIAVIRGALKNYEPRQLCEAILGCSRSPWHMGQNDRNTKYNGLSLILRSAENIDKFAQLASQTVVGEESIEQRNARIIAEFVAGGPPDDDLNIIDMEAPDAE